MSNRSRMSSSTTKTSTEAFSGIMLLEVHNCDLSIAVRITASSQKGSAASRSRTPSARRNEARDRAGAEPATGFCSRKRTRNSSWAGCVLGPNFPPPHVNPVTGHAASGAYLFFNRGFAQGIMPVGGARGHGRDARRTVGCEGQGLPRNPGSSPGPFSSRTLLPLANSRLILSTFPEVLLRKLRPLLLLLASTAVGVPLAAPDPSRCGPLFDAYDSAVWLYPNTRFNDAHPRLKSAGGC